MENEIFKGNVLDIGMDNYGIVYSIYKNHNKDFSTEYIGGSNDSNDIKENSYDICVLFLSFSSIMFKIRRKNLIDRIYSYLKDGGFVYVWDIDKGYGRTFLGNIKVILPEGKSKEISLKCINIFEDTSAESTIKLLKEGFNIIDYKPEDGVYYIKARKKRRNNDEEIEGSISGD